MAQQMEKHGKDAYHQDEAEDLGSPGRRRCHRTNHQSMPAPCQGRQLARCKQGKRALRVRNASEQKFHRYEMLSRKISS